MSSHVRIITPPGDQTFEEAAEWYDFASGRHFWFEWRLRALVSALEGVGVSPHRSMRVLDIGCGTGVLRDQLEAVTEWAIDGTDLNMEALKRARPGRGELYYYDVTEENPEFLGAYEAILLFDVIEHITDVRSFLRSAIRHLRPGGIVMINVPALQSLFSEYDRAAGHVRRYDRRTLRTSLEEVGIRVELARYWGGSMVPLLGLRKVLLSVRPPSLSTLRFGFVPPHPLAEKFLRAMMMMESLLPAPPLGSSVLSIGRRLD